MSQTSQLFILLDDGLPHSTVEIMQKVYGGSHLGLARVAARVNDLKKKGYEIKGWKDKYNKTVYWYQLIKEPVYTQAGLFTETMAKEALIN